MSSPTATAPASDSVLKSTSFFQQLNDYCLLDIFKYLPLKERVRMERVDIRFRRVLFRIWFNQSALVVSLDCVRLHAILACGHSGHSFGDGDVWHLRDPDDNLPSEVLKRCLNLKAFYWFGEKFDLFQELATFCPRLEHLYFCPQTKTSVKALQIYNKTVAQMEVKCLEMSLPKVNDPSLLRLYNPEKSKKSEAYIEKMYQVLLQFLERCPHLELLSLQIQNYVDMNCALPAALFSILSRVKKVKIRCTLHLYVRDVVAKLIEAANDWETFAFTDDQFVHEIGEDKVRLMTQKMPKLKAVELLNITDKSVNCLMKFGTNLREISLIQSNFNPELVPQKEALKILKLRFMKKDTVDAVPHLFPNLEELYIRFDSPSKSLADDYFLSLKHLKTLSLEMVSMEDKAIVSLLKHCPKISKAGLFECKGLTSATVGHFERHGQSHPKRVIKLYLKTDFEGISKKEGDILISGNLWIYYGVYLF